MDSEEAQDTRRDILHMEKKSVLTYMQFHRHTALPPKYCRRKNAADSVKYRQKGNELYKNNLHDSQVHEKIWKLYSQSIALAPNNSKELSLGYGNRSALLFHLKLYKESITDCDRAIHLTSSISLKIKLLSRKAECLALLKESSAKDVAAEALRLINTSQLEFTLASDLKYKLTNIIVSVRNTNSKRSSSKKNYYDELVNFPRQYEAPCASESVSIKYNETWGRHIVAEKDIEPGEIISIEDNCYTFITPNGMYLYCSHCTNYTWSSIPCEHCIYDVYCSESCRAEAWIKYHQFECPVYPYLWDIDEDISVNQFSIRLLLTAIHQAGSIDQMRKQIEEIEYCQDLRVKGFTNGVFQSHKLKSYYSLMSNRGKVQYDIKSSIIEHTCTNAYYLATHTNLFGRRLNILDSEMFLNEDILFVAALLLRTHWLTTYNITKISADRGSIICYAQCTHSFYSLFNHSCDPNVDSFVAKNNKTIVYAVQPITKGSQLFTSYAEKFYEEPRKTRRLYLKSVLHFTCRCLACTEKWSHICLPSFEQLEETTPALQKTMVHVFHKMRQLCKLKNDITCKKTPPYDPKLMKDTLYFLRKVAKKITVHCSEYVYALDFLNYLLLEVFGKYTFEIPSECS